MMSLPVYSLRRAASQAFRAGCLRSIYRCQTRMKLSGSVICRQDMPNLCVVGGCICACMLRVTKTSLQSGHWTHEGRLFLANDMSSKQIGHAWIVSSAFGRISLRLSDLYLTGSLTRGSLLLFLFLLVMVAKKK